MALRLQGGSSQASCSGLQALARSQARGNTAGSVEWTAAADLGLPVAAAPRRSLCHEPAPEDPQMAEQDIEETENIHVILYYK